MYIINILQKILLLIITLPNDGTFMSFLCSSTIIKNLGHYEYLNFKLTVSMNSNNKIIDLFFFKNDQF